MLSYFFSCFDRRLAFFSAVLPLIILLDVQVAEAQSQTGPETKNVKQYELGVGFGVQNLPDYRGSKRYRSLALPFPMIRYSGDIIQVDEKGLRSRFLLSDRLEFDISTEVSLTVGVDDNDLRNEMPALRPAFEMGPSLNIKLSSDPSSKRWTLRLPFRGVAGADLSKVERIGLVFNPQLVYQYKSAFSGVRVVARAGVLFADNDYHNYYYSVAEKYASVSRSEFSAPGGYSGAVFKVSVKKRFEKLWLATTLRYDNLSGATFQSSPLLESHSSYAISAGLGWFMD